MHRIHFHLRNHIKIPNYYKIETFKNDESYRENNVYILKWILSYFDKLSYYKANLIIFSLQILFEKFRSKVSVESVSEKDFRDINFNNFLINY